MRHLFLTSLFFLFSLSAWSFADLPNEDQLLSIWQQKAKIPAVGQQFEMLIWNVQKGQGREVWADDFQRISKQSDFILFQEAMEDSFMPSVFAASANLDIFFGISFFSSNHSEATGVLTASRIQVAQAHPLRSPDREPIYASPKMSLLTWYAIENQPEMLLIINTHALNFVGSEKFFRQITAVSEVLSQHKGPVIWAGDFNTWNNNRMDLLNDLMNKYSLTKLIPDAPKQPWLDHIYYRGCENAQAWVRSDIGSSDHSPLGAQFSNCH